MQEVLYRALSKYEEERLANIERNNEVLKSLGLVGTTKGLVGTTKKTVVSKQKRKSPEDRPHEELRRSARPKIMKNSTYDDEYDWTTEEDFKPSRKNARDEGSSSTDTRQSVPNTVKQKPAASTQHSHDMPFVRPKKTINYDGKQTRTRSAGQSTFIAEDFEGCREEAVAQHHRMKYKTYMQIPAWIRERYPLILKQNGQYQYSYLDTNTPDRRYKYRATFGINKHGRNVTEVYGFYCEAELAAIVGTIGIVEGLEFWEVMAFLDNAEYEEATVDQILRPHRERISGQSGAATQDAIVEQSGTDATSHDQNEPGQSEPATSSGYEEFFDELDNLNEYGIPELR